MQFTAKRMSQFLMEYYSPENSWQNALNIKKTENKLF